MEEFIREIFRNSKGGIIIKISKFLTIVLALITALLIFDRSSGCTNNNPGSWFGDSVSSEGTVNIGGSNPSTMALKTINGESLQGYGNINIDMDSVVDVDELPSNKVEWVGATVPNSGYVEKVYFNTNLSVEEVVALLDKLNFSNTFENFENVEILLITSSQNIMYKVVKDTKGYAMTVIAGQQLEIPFFVSFDNGTGYVGWLYDYLVEQDLTLPNPQELNEEVINDVGVEGVSIGSQNELLSSLFSITPFEKKVVESIDESKLYRLPSGDIYQYIGDEFVQINNPIYRDYDELPEVGYKGTAIPFEGTIDSLYINKNISYEKLSSIAKNLNFQGQETIPFLISDNWVFMVICESNTIFGDLYQFAGYSESEDLFYNFFIVADIFYNQDNFINQDVDFSYFENISFTLGFPEEMSFDKSIFENNNELLSCVFSITPFEYIDLDKNCFYRTLDTSVYYLTKYDTFERILDLDSFDYVMSMDLYNYNEINIIEIPFETYDQVDSSTFTITEFSTNYYSFFTEFPFIKVLIGNDEVYLYKKSKNEISDNTSGTDSYTFEGCYLNSSSGDYETIRLIFVPGIECYVGTFEVVEKEHLYKYLFRIINLQTIYDDEAPVYLSVSFEVYTSKLFSNVELDDYSNGKTTFNFSCIFEELFDSSKDFASVDANGYIYSPSKDLYYPIISLFLNSEYLKFVPLQYNDGVLQDVETSVTPQYIYLVSFEKIY